MQRVAETAQRLSILSPSAFATSQDLDEHRPDAARFADFKVIRRNGSVVGFEPGKIAVAMTKAFPPSTAATGPRRRACANWSSR